MHVLKTSKVARWVVAVGMAVTSVGAGGGAIAGAATRTTEKGSAATAATTSTAYVAEVGPKIHLHQDANGKQGKEVERFLPTERVQRFYVKLPKLKLRTKIRWVFTAVNTVQGDNIKVAEATASSLVANEVTGNVSLQNDWPLGTYRAELFVDGKATARRDYAVTIPVSEQTIDEFRLFLDDGGSPGKEVKSWSPADRKVHFRVTSDGLLSPGTVVNCILRNGTRDVGVVKVTVPAVQLQTNFVMMHFSAPTEWGRGTYSLVIELDGREAGRARYTVV